MAQNAVQGLMLRNVKIKVALSYKNINTKHKSNKTSEIKFKIRLDGLI